MQHVDSLQWALRVSRRNTEYFLILKALEHPRLLNEVGDAARIKRVQLRGHLVLIYLSFKESCFSAAFNVLIACRSDDQSSTLSPHLPI